MSEINYSILLEKIKEMFIKEKEFILRKEVFEFEKDGKYVGDYYNFIMFEEKGSEAPFLYHVASPYDIVSNKAPQQALVWNGGKLVLNIDYTDYAAMRTGAMDALSLQLMGIESLKDKKILLFGTGRTGKWSIKILKEIYKDLATIDYINSTNTQSTEFERFCNEVGINAQIGNKNALEQYDYIFCHTDSKEILLTVDDMTKLKENVVVTTYISSPNSKEIADEFYTSSNNVIMDWSVNIPREKGMENMGLKEKDILTLVELLGGEKSIEKTKKTVFRFFGTPMQNLAVLKMLLNN